MGLPVIIKTNITKNTSAVQRAEFNIPLFIYDAGSSAAPDVNLSGRVRVYSTLDSILSDFTNISEPYLAAVGYFSQNPAVSQLIIGQYYSSGTADTNYVAAATACSLENDTWYQIGMESHVEAEVLAMAAYVEAKQRLYFTSNNVVSSADTAYVAGAAAVGDILGKLADSNYERTAVLWHHTADTKFPECAFAGRNLPFRAGKANWAHLALAGVGASQNALGNVLNDTQITNITARNGNFIYSQRGQFRTWQGTAVNGEWLDIVRGVDGLREDIDASLLDLLINQAGGGIRMTDAGIAQIENVLDSVLTRWVNYGFIQANYTLTMPKAIDISFADKAARIIKDIKFEAFLAGFVNAINPISGNVTYEV